MAAPNIAAVSHVVSQLEQINEISRYMVCGPQSGKSIIF